MAAMAVRNKGPVEWGRRSKGLGGLSHARAVPEPLSRVLEINESESTVPLKQPVVTHSSLDLQLSVSDPPPAESSPY